MPGPSLPTVLLSLQPDGTLALALPTDPGHTIPLKPSDILRTIQRVLHQQTLGESALSPRGGPTIAQARCWSEHSGAIADANCPFCRAAGRFDYKNPRKGTTRTTESGSASVRPGVWNGQVEGVAVRSYPAGKTGAQILATERKASRSLETTAKLGDLGL